MILQVPDQVAAEVADIGLEFSDVVPETVQLGDHDLSHDLISHQSTPLVANPGQGTHYTNLCPYTLDV